MVSCIKVKTSVDCVVIIDNSIIHMSLLLIETFKEFDYHSEINENDIPSVQVDRTILCKIIEYMEYHCYNEPIEIKKPLESNDLTKSGISTWDLNFIVNNDDVLIDILNASVYLGINSLMQLICAKFASMILEKSDKEIQTALNLTDDEFNEAKQQKNWCEHAN